MSELSAPENGGGFESPEVLRHVKGMWGVHGSGDTSGFSGLVNTEVMARPAARPYGGWFDEVVDVLIELLEADGVPANAAIDQHHIHPCALLRVWAEKMRAERNLLTHGAN